MSDGRDTSGAMHLETKEASDVLRRFAEVDAHPDSELLTCGPLMVAERPLHLDDR